MIKKDFVNEPLYRIVLIVSQIYGHNGILSQDFFETLRRFLKGGVDPKKRAEVEEELQYWLQILFKPLYARGISSLRVTSTGVMIAFKTVSDHTIPHFLEIQKNGVIKDSGILDFKTGERLEEGFLVNMARHVLSRHIKVILGEAKNHNITVSQDFKSFIYTDGGKILLEGNIVGE